MSNQVFKYFAFISYSSKDEKWAKWLHSKLEGYHIPASLCKDNPNIPNKIFPVFWFKKDLSGTTLKEALHKELSSSRYLIVICSPKSANSEWVNNEVEYFIQQGRSHMIIPFIVEGVPHANKSDEECFPPVLRNLSQDEELRGINVHRNEGRQHALVDVIATLLGIRFDEIWQRHERRQKKIRNLQIAAVFLLSVLSAFIYDYKQTKFEYYVDYIDCWGIPQGVSQLNKSQVKHRYHSYRFEYRRIPFGQLGQYSWRLDKVVLINSAGQPVNYDGIDKHERFASAKINYSEISGALTNIVYSSSNGKIQIRHNISNHDDKKAVIADLISSAEENGAGYSQMANSLDEFVGIVGKGQNKPMIKRYHYIRSDEGFISQLTFHCNNADDLNSSRIADADGIYGLRYTRDSLGRTIKVTYLDKNNKPTKNKYGVSAKKYTYDTNGNISQLEYLDINDSKINNELYWSYISALYDDFGNLIESCFFNAEGNPCYSKYGVHKWCLEYNKRGYLIWQMGLNINGVLCESQSKYAAIRRRYDRKGNCLAEAYYGKNGELCYSSFGIAGWNANYDRKGNRIKQSYFSTDLELMRGPNGVYVNKYKYDKHGNLIEETNHDKWNRKCLNSSNYYKRINEYNSENQLIKDSYYGVDNNLCHNNYGYSYSTLKYDSRGNLVEIASYNINNECCDNKLGFAKAIMVYDSFGNCIEATYYNPENVPAKNLDGVAKYTLRYDDNGNLIEKAGYNENNEACMGSAGFHKFISIYNSWGSLIEMKYYNTENCLCNMGDGFAVYKSKYDSLGRCVEETFYNPEGDLTNNKKGIAKTNIEYNQYGFISSITSYDEDGNEI